MRTQINRSLRQGQRSVAAVLLAIAVFGASGIVQAQQAAAPQGTRPAPGTASVVAQPAVPSEYVVGPEDVLGVNFWKDTEMTGDVTVRPDGKITIPLLGDIDAAGLTPTQLADRILQAAKKLIADPTVTVLVRTINSRKVYITGQVANPGAYPLTGPRTVMQLIALAGGLSEYADKKNITINRVEQGKSVALKFNYGDVSKGKNLAQNIVLQPGDTVVVP